jgi:3-oxoacyl-[acyl-carrier-protein] synthase-3
MRAATITAITSFLPGAVLSNQALAELYPNWSADKIFEKTGAREHRICEPDQTAGDLAEAAKPDAEGGAEARPTPAFAHPVDRTRP